MPIRITDRREIPESELEERFSRAGGPGGQNVNKVSTAVELRFDAVGSRAIPPEAKARLKRLAGRRWTASGQIVIRCDETRSQMRNREIARARLAELVRRALVAPAKRRPTKPTRASVERRIAAKKRRSDTKRRRKPEWD